jgi:molybdopterin molybdotransferase
LPGNPRAVLVAWYLFVRPFLLAVQGATGPVLRSESLPLSEGLTLKGARAEFRAASVRAGVVHLLADEGSHMLSSLIAANAIAYFPATVRRAEAGELTEVYYLPGR